MNINLTLFGQMITFGTFVWFTMRFVCPPIIQVMQDREKKISDGLAAAEKGHHDLQLSKKMVVQDLKQAKKDANLIIDKASKRALMIIEESKEHAKLEGNRLISAAKKEIENEVQQAKQSLKEDVSKMALIGIEKIISKTIDSESHQKLIDDVLKEID